MDIRLCSLLVLILPITPAHAGLFGSSKPSHPDDCLKPLNEASQLFDPLNSTLAITDCYKAENNHETANSYYFRGTLEKLYDGYQLQWGAYDIASKQDLASVHAGLQKAGGNICGAPAAVTDAVKDLHSRVDPIRDRMQKLDPELDQLKAWFEKEFITTPPQPWQRDLTGRGYLRTRSNEFCLGVSRKLNDIYIRLRSASQSCKAMTTSVADTANEVSGLDARLSQGCGK